MLVEERAKIPAPIFEKFDYFKVISSMKSQQKEVNDQLIEGILILFGFVDSWMILIFFKIIWLTS